MTAQMPDNYFYEGNHYSIIAMSENVCFNPKEYGLEPVMASTACWRGYYIDYAIEDRKLFLKNIYLRESMSGYPKINNVSVSRVKGNCLFDYAYKDINKLISYTGKLVIGNGFIDEYYVHMGFQCAWAYKTVLELVFKEGILLEVVDHSDTVGKIRENRDWEVMGRNEKDIRLFVAKGFSLTMKDKAWWIEDN